MIRPEGIEDLYIGVRDYILFLEKENTKLERLVESLRLDMAEESEDVLIGLYRALSYQLKRINKELMNAEISFSEKNEKTYDRFWKAMVDSKDVASNMLWLKKELKITDGTTDKQETAEQPKRPRSPIEEAAFRRTGSDNGSYTQGKD